MAKTCVFCGRSVGFFGAYNECLWEVEPNQHAKTASVSYVLPIAGAPKGLGFCEYNRCAQKLSIILSFLFTNGKISHMPAMFGGKVWNDRYSQDLRPEVIDALDYCKSKKDKISDPIIKTQVMEWLSMAEELVEKQNDKAAADEIKMTFMDNYFSARDAFLDAGISFTASSGEKLSFANKTLYLALARDLCEKVLLPPPPLPEGCGEEFEEIFKELNAQYPGMDYYSANNFSAALDKTIAKIPVEDIVYFKETGNVEHLTKISGGEMSGGGANIQGASTGAFWFGAAGAIVGSQIGTEIKSSGIKTTIETLDSRKVLLCVRVAGEIRTQELSYDCYSFLMREIAGKEFSVVNLESQKSKVALPPQEENHSNAFEEIKKYKELLDCGILTEEEFQAKKRELLNL